MDILNKVQGCKTAPAGQFQNFQGGLKELSKENLEKIKLSIKEIGFTAPLFIWRDKILDGHQRKKALEELQKEGHNICEVPYVEIVAETEAEAKKILLTYVSQYGLVTKDGLAEYIKEAGLNALELQQFTVLPLDDLIAQSVTPDEPEIEEPMVPVSQHGELYQLGNHRLMCGDSTKSEDVAKLLRGGGFEGQYGFYRSALQC